MRQLFSMDARDYDPNAKPFVRPSVRGILIRGGKIAMIHSLVYDYYKFPGGGIDSGESHEQTLIREVAEEAGLTVIAQTIQPFGQVHRVSRGDQGDIFIQDNYYYLCQAEPEQQLQQLEDYEAKERFVMEWVDPRQAIRTNRQPPNGIWNQQMRQREAQVLEILLREGYFTLE